MKKNKRQKREAHLFKKRAGFTDTHHLVPKSRGGSNRKANRLRLDAYRHDSVHLLFGDHTLDEIIAILIRLRDMKNRQRKS